ncbi:MAG: hypothetical protein RQ866_00625 [Bacteroidales bacterium]|nr:hypothetical protein [Bacteroidales bacterium]
MQRIAFFCYDNQVNYHHVGGMDSLVRRLAHALIKLGDQVDIVHYGSDNYQSEQLCDGIKQLHFCDFEDACQFLSEECDDVLSIHLRRADRIKYAKFRRQWQNKVRFHHIYSVWNESRIKRELLFSEARLFPFNGCLFCLSPRFYKTVSRWSKRAVLLLPPVDHSYFCTPSEKSNSDKLRIAFAGRVDPGKGVQNALDVFSRLGDKMDIDARVCGYAWSHRAETIEMHESLIANPEIRYEPVEYKKWDQNVDDDIVSILHNSDILLLPYQKLSSTVDTPLLLLEGMASLCTIITPPLGDLHLLYGESIFNIGSPWDSYEVVDLILAGREQLHEERGRILLQNDSLCFDSKSVAAQLKKSMLDC